MHERSFAICSVTSNSREELAGRAGDLEVWWVREERKVGGDERWQLKVRPAALHSAYIQVEVFAESAAAVISVDILGPTVKELMQIVQIILASAAG